VTDLTPLQRLFDVEAGVQIPLPDDLWRFYGPLCFPARAPHVVGNFVSTIDGVVSFAIPGRSSGREISGDDPHDRMVMGLLRAVADVIVVSGSIFNASATRQWTAENAYPPLSASYRSLRQTLNKPERPVVAIVTTTGQLNLIDGASHQPMLVLTTPDGQRHLQRQTLPPSIQVVAVDTDRLSAHHVLCAIQGAISPRIVLVETGPKLMGNFLGEARLNELFLTVAPQVAGRDLSATRPGFVSGRQFMPADSPWASLVSVRRAGSHLFLRYSFDGALPPIDSSGCG
jgi:riboflavin biosynthesis pyrimidine reductase